MRGFTLLESLLYIALFTLIMTGTLASIAALTESLNRNETQALLESEGMFMSNKLDYEISQASSASVVTASSTNDSLVLATTAGPVSIQTQNGAVSLSRNGAPPSIFSSPDVRVVDLSFTKSSNAYVSSVQTSFTLYAFTASGHMLSEAFSTSSFLSS